MIAQMNLFRVPMIDQNKTKVFQNVNRMSKRQSDRKEDIQRAGHTDRVTERQNDSMADSRATKGPSQIVTI